jgi:hypothetical protein
MSDGGAVRGTAEGTPDSEVSGLAVRNPAGDRFAWKAAAAKLSVEWPFDF